MEENLMFRRTIVSALALMVCAVLAHGEGAIRFRNGSLEMARKSSTGVAEDLAAIASVRSAGATHVIVQFEQPVTDEIKSALNAAGLTLQDYLGDNGFFAAVRH